MQRILAKKTVSMTDMRDPKGVLEFANGETVAVMNRNKVVGYFVPEIEQASVRYADAQEVERASEKIHTEYTDVLDYLKDK